LLCYPNGVGMAVVRHGFSCDLHHVTIKTVTMHTGMFSTAEKSYRYQKVIIL